MGDHFGVLSLVPPILAIVVAIWTKRIILSLFIGIVAGLLIYTGSIGGTLVEATEVMVGTISDDWNARLILFTALLGGLLGIMYRSGGAIAFGEAAVKLINTRKKALVGTWLMGVLIFFDDYFNILTVGSVMRNITDRFNISREKLAYIIDSTAAPVCIIVPISTWVAYAMSLYITEFERLGIEIKPFDIFLETIPYNFYAVLAVIVVFYLSVSNLDFGPMAKAEKRAMEKGQVFDQLTKDEIPGQDIASLETSTKGTLWDLLIPIAVLIVATIIGLMYTGGYWEPDVGFREAIGDADSATALVYATLIANIIGLLMYTTRKIITVKDTMESFVTGIKAMVPALSILILAWSIGDVANLLGTGAFVAEYVTEALPYWLLPLFVFLISAFISFTTGTSWGTFAIMMPIAVPIAVVAVANPAMFIAAVFGGSVFGDHCSPISDTTVLSSTGAACNHIDHVRTQLPYALVVAGIAAIGYVIAGLMNTSYIPLVVVLVLTYVVFLVLHKRTEKITTDE